VEELIGCPAAILSNRAALLNAATLEVRKAMILAIDTGLRREELFSLRLNQIDLGLGIITTTKKTKSGRPRSVPLPERSRSILPAVPGVDDYVLINPKTKKRYVQMNKGLKAAVRRAGIAPLQWHDLRRTAGCRWLQRDGKSMEEVSILLGHSSVQVTEQRYAFLESEKVAASLSGRTKTGTAIA
jgi:integrase/recombinase XerD